MMLIAPAGHSVSVQKRQPVKAVMKHIALTKSKRTVVRFHRTRKPGSHQATVYEPIEVPRVASEPRKGKAAGDALGKDQQVWPRFRIVLMAPPPARAACARLHLRQRKATREAVTQPLVL